ncbi:MAG: putative two-component response regulator [Mycobacterium sp.]|nr:putative two-component response regulator [Mycobacterium sp.]
MQDATEGRRRAVGGATTAAAALRVLLVDDTSHVRVMLREMLSLDGFDVVADTGDPLEVNDLARAHDPRVVVMDLKMPGIDGLEATRRLVAERPDQIVVLYTAFLDAEVAERARAAGAALCLEKVDGLPHLEQELGRLAALHQAPDLG